MDLFDLVVEKVDESLSNYQPFLFPYSCEGPSLVNPTLQDEWMVFKKKGNDLPCFSGEDSTSILI